MRITPSGDARDPERRGDEPIANLSAAVNSMTCSAARTMSLVRPADNLAPVACGGTALRITASGSSAAGMKKLEHCVGHQMRPTVVPGRANAGVGEVDRDGFAGLDRKQVGRPEVMVTTSSEAAWRSMQAPHRAVPTDGVPRDRARASPRRRDRARKRERTRRLGRRDRRAEADVRGKESRPAQPFYDRRVPPLPRLDIVPAAPRQPRTSRSSTCCTGAPATSSR